MEESDLYIYRIIYVTFSRLLGAWLGYIRVDIVGFFSLFGSTSLVSTV